VEVTASTFCIGVIGRELQILDVASNMLTGPIDAVLRGLPLLKELRVNNNNLTGTLPEHFASSYIEAPPPLIPLASILSHVPHMPDVCIWVQLLAMGWISTCL